MKRDLDTFWGGVIGATLAYTVLAAVTILIGGDAGYVACYACPFVGVLGFAVGILVSLDSGGSQE